MTTFSGHFLGPDTHANRPAVTGLPNGTQYFCTTHSKVERVVSGAWADYYSVGGTETLPATIFDAKGDILVGSAADVGAPLPVGSNGQVLTADSAQALGVKWATPSAAAAGAMTLLSTTTLSSAGTFDVSSISGAYNDLVCILIARGANASAIDQPKWQLNGDTGNNYAWHEVRGNSTSVTSLAVMSTAQIVSGRITGSTATANSFGCVEFTIFGYASTVWTKGCQWRSFGQNATGAGGLDAQYGGGQWLNTAAVTRIQVAGFGTANFLTGSQLRIYGRL